MANIASFMRAGRSGPVNQPPKPIRAAFCNPQRKKMLRCVQSADLIGLVDEIDTAEAVYAVDKNISRIKHESFKGHAALLLASRPRRVLEAIVTGTLTQQQFASHEIRRPGDGHAWGGHYDPSIYANIIADDEGYGLTCDEFEAFLVAMEIGGGVIPDDGRFNRDTSNAHGSTLRAGISLGYRYLANSQKDFYDDTLSTDIGRFRKKVESFVDTNRVEVLVKARAEGIDHIMLPPEIGWALETWRRCQEHRKLRSSPDVFRLAQLVLRHIYPNRGFRLHQYIIFDVTEEVQAAVGESVASQLCTSYKAYGGFNRAQAGISDRTSHQMDGYDWARIRAFAVRKNYFRYIQENFEASEKYYETQRSEAQARLDQAELQQAYDTELADLNRNQDLLNQQRPELEGEIANLQAALEGLAKRREYDTEHDYQIGLASEAAILLTSQMGLSLPNSRPAAATQNVASSVAATGRTRAPAMRQQKGVPTTMPDSSQEQVVPATQPSSSEEERVPATQLGQTSIDVVPNSQPGQEEDDHEFGTPFPSSAVN